MKGIDSKKLVQITLLFSGAFWFIACSHTELVKDRQKILDILNNEQLAHLTENPDLFITEFADSTYQVSNGNVEYITRNQAKALIVNYFETSKIIKWDDLQAPVIHFSKDRTMAYAILKKLVVTEPEKSASEVKKDTTIFSWVSIYIKSGREWRLVCNVSTRS
jgi:hypothetical protein